MNNFLYDEQAEIMSYNIYNPKNKVQLDGWNLIKHVRTNSGFEGMIYHKNNEVMVVYKGTEIQDLRDITNDIQMAVKQLPGQQTDAENLRKLAQILFPNAKKTLTGHSLGGSLAQIESAKSGLSAITFAAYGTGDILKKMGYSNTQIQNMNITNYGNLKDPIFISNINKQPGKSFITNTNLDTNETYNIVRGNKSGSIKQHLLEKMGDLKKAVEVKTDKIYPRKSQPLQGHIYQTDIIFEDTENPLIFTREDIGNMSQNDFNRYEKFINRQMETVGIPFKEELPKGAKTWGSEKAKQNYSNEKGRWVTIKGRHVFIED